MSMTTNKTVLDLAKVQHATLWWGNGQEKRHHKPDCPTYHGMPVPDGLAAPIKDYPGETMLERAIRRNLLDVWTPIVCFQLTANHKIVYTGEKALSMWKAWNARIYGEKKGKKCKD